MSEELTIRVSRRTYDPFWKLSQAIENFLRDKVVGQQDDVIITVKIQKVDEVIG